MGGLRHSDDTKAACMAALLSGQSVDQVAKEYNIPKQTISRWKNGDTLNGTDGTKKKEIGELIEGYLRENLTTLRAQAEFFRDEKWLSRQSADSAAVLHGVMTDKAIRILEALAKANPTAESDTQGS